MKKVFIFLLITSFSNLIAQNTLLKELAVGNESSNIHHPVEVNGSIYFFQKDPNSPGKFNLGVSNGTSGGTSIVKNPYLPIIYQGPFFSEDSDFELAKLNNSVVFGASKDPNITSKFNNELWVSDGTSFGTKEIMDIEPGTTGSLPHNFKSLGTSLVVFLAKNSTIGEELYVTDGTAIGTLLLKDIKLGTGDSQITDLTEFNNRIYFWADDGIHGRELWRTDGTSFGTVLVEDHIVGPDSSSPLNNPIIATDNLLFFAIYSISEGEELGTYNGNSIQIYPVFIGIYNSFPSDFTVISKSQDIIAFKAYDGTTLKMYKYVNSQIFQITATNGGSFYQPENLVGVGNTLIFTAFDSIDGIGLWKHNIYNSSTIKIADINTNPSNGYDDTFSIQANSKNSYVQFITNNNKLYFVANDGINGFELWSYNVSFNSLNKFPDFNPTGDSNFSYFRKTLDDLYFIAFNGTEHEMCHLNLNTNVLKKSIDFNNYEAFENPYPLIGSAYSLFFVAHSSTSGYELYKANGTNTALIKDINLEIPTTNLNAITSNGTNTIFVNYETKSGNELWTSNGKISNTKLLFDSSPYPIAEDYSFLKGDFCGLGSDYNNFYVFNGYYYFQLNNRIWKTDGITSVTLFSDDSESCSIVFYNSIVHFAEMNGFLYFSYAGNLYKSDGSIANTTIVYSIGDFQNIIELKRLNSDLYFGAKYYSGNDAIFKLNGLTDEVSLVKEFDYYAFVNGLNMVVNNNLLFFSMSDVLLGAELWKTDGTTAGTLLLKDIVPGANSSSPFILTSFNNILYFNAFDQVSYSMKFWRTDGTLAGTYKFMETLDIYYADSFNDVLVLFVRSSALNRAFYSSDGTIIGTKKVEEFLSIGGVLSIYKGNKSLYVVSGTTNYPYNETELFRWDGKYNGEKVKLDIFPGPNSSEPYNLKPGNGLIYFLAKNDFTFKYNLHVVKDCFTSFSATGNINSNSNLGEIIKLTSTQTISSPSRTDYFSQKSIELKPGFKVNPGSVFKAQIGGCVHDPAN
jgi:trimeric autotransporter adhesin